MNTYVVLISNSDHKISRTDWASLIMEVKNCINLYATEVYFDGVSGGIAAQESACFVTAMDAAGQRDIVLNLEQLRSKYKQDSIAVVAGDTTFIGKQ